MSSLKNKGLKAFSWDFIGKLGQQGVGFIISILLARLLSPEDFGLLAMANVIIAMAAVFVDMGLSNALIQRKEPTDYHYGSVFYFNVGVGILLFLLFFLLAKPIASFYDKPVINSIIKVLSFSFIINSFCNVQRAWLRKKLKYDVLTKAQILSIIVSGTIGITLALLDYGVWALVIQSLFGGLINNFYIYFATPWKPKLFFKFYALKQLWGFGFRMFLSGLLDAIFTRIDAMIIGKRFTPATLGFYHRAKSLDQFVIRYTSGSLMSVIFPVLSEIQKNEIYYKQIVHKALHILSFITFPVLGILYLVAEDIIVLLFSSKWLPSVEYYKIIVLGGFVFPLSSLLVNILSSRGNSKGFLKLTLLKQSILTINFGLIIFFSLKTYLYGLVVANILSLILNIIFASKEIKVKDIWFYKVILPYAIISVILTILLLFVNLKTFIHNSVLYILLILILFIGSYILIIRIIGLPSYDYINREVRTIFSKIKYR